MTSTAEKITYTITVGFGKDVRTIKKHTREEVEKVVELVEDLGGIILEVEYEKLP